MINCQRKQFSSKVFGQHCGTNIRLSDDKKSANRVQGYNNALVCLSKPLARGQSVSLKVNQLSPKWNGSLALGVIGVSPNTKITLPSTSINLERPCWIITQEHFNINGTKSRTTKFSEALDQIESRTVITVSLSLSSALTFAIGAITFTDIIVGLPNQVHPIFDLYGKCQKVSIISNDNQRIPTSASDENFINNQEAESI